MGSRVDNQPHLSLDNAPLSDLSYKESRVTSDASLPGPSTLVFQGCEFIQECGKDSRSREGWKEQGT